MRTSILGGELVFNVAFGDKKSASIDISSLSLLTPEGFKRDCAASFQRGADGGNTVLSDTADRIFGRNGRRG
jgi:hypothetical protein